MPPEPPPGGLLSWHGRKGGKKRAEKEKGDKNPVLVPGQKVEKGGENRKKAPFGCGEGRGRSGSLWRGEQHAAHPLLVFQAAPENCLSHVC